MQNSCDYLNDSTHFPRLCQPRVIFKKSVQTDTKLCLLRMACKVISEVQPVHEVQVIGEVQHVHEAQVIGEVQHAHEAQVIGEVQHAREAQVIGEVQHAHEAQVIGEVQHAHEAQVIGEVQHANEAQVIGEVQHAHVHIEASEMSLRTCPVSTPGFGLAVFTQSRLSGQSLRKWVKCVDSKRPVG